MTRLIKVALINNVIPTYREDFIRRIINSKEIDLKMYVCDKINFLKIKTIHCEFKDHVYITKNRSFSKWSVLFQKIPFLKILKDSDIIIVDGNPRHITLLFSSFFFKLLGKKVIIWSCAYSFENHNKITEKIRLYLWRYFKYFFLYTEKDLQYINSLKFSYRYAISLNNGLDQDNINKEKISWSKENLIEWRINNSVLNNRIILSCSRVEKGRYDDFLTILPKLLIEYEDLVWCLIGEGDALEEIKTFIKSNNIEKRVRICGAIYDEKELAPWFLSSSFFVYPTAIGLSLMHAFGYGLPVITHDKVFAHGPEFCVFENLKTGLLYEQNNVIDLKEKIELLLNDVSLNSEMKKNVLSIVNDKYNTRIMSQNFINGVVYIYNLSNKKNA